LPETPATPHIDTDYFDKALEAIRAKLLDTTRRNRLLNYRESVRDVAVIDEMPDQIHDHLVVNGKPFFFDPTEEEPDGGGEPEGDLALLDVSESAASGSRELPQSQAVSPELAPNYQDDRLQTDHNEKELDRRLKRLYQEHRSIIEETGANNLYLTMGFLEWNGRREDRTSQRSPLMLIPVRLERQGGAGEAVYSMVFDDEALDTNYSLLEKLKHTFDLELPELVDEQTPEEYWREVQRAIGKKAEEGWQLIREVSLVLLRFQKQVMWHDLDPERWPSHSPLVDKDTIRRVLLGPARGNSAPGILDVPHEQDSDEVPAVPLIREADSSQFSALVDALHREDGLVIEGPPGTGKSQTITNLIAAAMSEGKSVLFVAEKMAALEVVSQRLSERGLGDFCLELHGLKTGKKELLESVKRRLEKRHKGPQDHAHVAEELRQAKLRLTETSKSLKTKVGPEGLDLRQVFWRIERLRRILPEGYEPSVGTLETSELEQLTYARFVEIRQALDDLGREWDGIPPTARHAWRGFHPGLLTEANREGVKALLGANIDSLCESAGSIGAHRAGELLARSPVSRHREIAATNTTEALSPLPATVSGPIAKRILQSDHLGRAKGLLASIEKFDGLVSEVNRVFDFAAENSDSWVVLVDEHLGALGGSAIDAQQLVGNLANESRTFAALIRQLEEAESTAAPVTKVIGGFARTLDDCRHLADDAKNLRSGPDELFLHARPALCGQPARALLADGIERQKQLEESRSALSQFQHDRIGDTSALVASIRVIEELKTAFVPSLRSRYREAKRHIRSVLSDPKSFNRKDPFIAELGDLERFLAKRDEFAEDSPSSAHFGDLFSGIDTDWERLRQIVEHAHRLRKQHGSEFARSALSDWSSYSERMEEAESKLREIGKAVRAFADSHPFPSTLWERPLPEIAAALDKWRVRIEAAQGELLQPWLNSRATTQEALDAVNSHRAALSIQESVERDAELRYLVDWVWEQTETNPEPLRQLCDWIDAALASPGFDREFLCAQFSDDGTLDLDGFERLHDDLGSISRAIAEQLGRLGDLGEVDAGEWLAQPTGTLSDLIAKLEAASGEIDGLLSIARWENFRVRVSDYGLAPIVGDLIDERISGRNCATAYQFWMYQTLAEEKVRGDRLLAEFGHESYESLRERFAHLDRSMLDQTAEDIASRLSRKKTPAGVGSGRVGHYTETALLRHEAEKKRRHIPIRSLVARSGNALQALKPCFLMSPLSVAQFLPPGQIEFDFVVMDEASQIRPEDALGALARGRKAIIVGDPKQLPPTSFFDTSSRDDDEAEETVLDDTESILEVCLKQFPFRRLRWHYRSEHEDLIRFSNERFYDNDLVIFPSPCVESRDYGVHSNFISEPSYKKGRNRAEAERVASAIAAHYRNHPGVSLGVAAFNKRQAEEIQLLLDQIRRENPDIDRAILEVPDREALFVKNLENVQGDERDVIFVSTTYGPEFPGGRTYQRFGPLNSDVGWRRLNVVVTRAKKRLEVFTSMRPTDILAGEGSSRGVRALRDYLEFAETGYVQTTPEPSGGEYENDFEEAVGSLVEALGFEVVPQVGVEGFFIDLGVKHPDLPGEYILGIECDGATYHSAPSVRDRDRLRQEILESKGWNIHRVWSTSWFHRRSLEVQRLQEALSSSLEDAKRVSSERQRVRMEMDRGNEGLGLSEGSSDQEATLRNALERFWTKNIGPDSEDRGRSLLSQEMIEILVRKKPENRGEWFSAVPQSSREQINPREMEHLPAVLEVIYELS